MKKSLSIDVLNKGFVKVYETGILGNDLTVVNSARVSFGKRKEELDRGDIRLMKYLKEHKHFSPFRHIQVQFHARAPEFVTRQWYKHVVGIETTSTYATKDHAWNELSLRYVQVDDYYIPENWRKQADNNKQGSAGSIDKQKDATEKYDTAMKVAFGLYNQLIELGVAKEQSRIVLPLSVYTEFYWTASFQAIMNFLELRTADDAQWEIQQYADAVKKIMLELYPVTTRVWLNPELSPDDLLKFL